MGSFRGRKINQIVVHCSYTPPSMDIGVDTIIDWHVYENGWDDIGYHYVITRDGEIEEGRPLHIAGAHVRGHNDHTVGVCLVGGMAEDEQTPESNFTHWQWDALDQIVDQLEGLLGRLDMVGHRDLDPSKSCPCFNVRAWRDKL